MYAARTNNSFEWEDSSTSVRKVKRCGQLNYDKCICKKSFPGGKDFGLLAGRVCVPRSSGQRGVQGIAGEEDDSLRRASCLGDVVENFFVVFHCVTSLFGTVWNKPGALPGEAEDPASLATIACWC